MRIKDLHGHRVIRGLLLSLALFLTLGNTLKLVNHSKSVLEFAQYASHPTKHADSNPVKGIQAAKYIEISEVEVEVENEDQPHNLQGCFPLISDISLQPISSGFKSKVVFEKDIPGRPLFLLYCQRKHHLA
ncbi:MAG: hypothetical protein IPN73_10630 [Saprospiraceae bacterium]|nr:hypothetical protein [Saprospiraceae bacterium]MBK7786990.1 hypothetical protein [Saprospiraceae bacterium]MBK8110067.1 hypothetical protein [Saprospiraceae bacterium]MBK8850599.1 hypothetical protein [Saprospiraceae bacterium]MBK9689940.1 hypothetical protein [Saprospiraceae bacterium]